MAPFFVGILVEGLAHRHDNSLWHRTRARGILVPVTDEGRGTGLQGGDVIMLALDQDHFLVRTTVAPRREPFGEAAEWANDPCTTSRPVAAPARRRCKLCPCWPSQS